MWFLRTNLRHALSHEHVMETSGHSLRVAAVHSLDSFLLSLCGELGVMVHKWLNDTAGPAQVVLVSNQLLPVVNAS